MAGSLPSGETSVARASTRCHAGLSRRALLLECTSLRGPRPHFSPLEMSSSSTTPLAPRNWVTSPSRPCAGNGVKRGEACGFGAFLVHSAAADDHFTEAGLVDQRGVPGRRGPFGGINLLYVIHEIEADGFGSAGVEGGEDAGLAVGGNLGDLREAGFAKHLHGELAAFVHTAIFGGDGGLANPGLQALEGFVVTLVDFGEDGVEVGGCVGGKRPAR